MGRSSKGKGRRICTKKYSYVNLSWPGLPVVYLPCPHQHLKSPTVDRKSIDREQHINLLSTPKGYRWDNPQDNKKQLCPGKQSGKKKLLCIEPSDKQQCKSSMDDVWKCMTPDLLEKICNIFVDDFQLSKGEAKEFVNEQKDYSKASQKMSVCKCPCAGDSDNQYLWMKEFTDLIGCKLRNHIGLTLCSWRTKRQKMLMELVVNCMSDISGENINIACPETRMQKIMVFAADRMGVWLDRKLDEADKKILEEDQEAKDAEIAEKRRKEEEEEAKREGARKEEEDRRKREEEEEEAAAAAEAEAAAEAAAAAAEAEAAAAAEAEAAATAEAEAAAAAAAAAGAPAEEAPPPAEEAPAEAPPPAEPAPAEAAPPAEEAAPPAEEAAPAEEAVPADEAEAAPEEAPAEAPAEEAEAEAEAVEGEEPAVEEEAVEGEVEEVEAPPEAEEEFAPEPELVMEIEEAPPAEAGDLAMKVIVDWITATDLAPSDRQKQISKVVKGKLSSTLQDYADVEGMGTAIDALGNKVSTWIDKLASDAEKEMKPLIKAAAGKKFPAPKGVLYHIKRGSDNYYKVRQVSCTDVASRKTAIDRPMTSEDVKDFTNWAEGLIHVSDAWTKWVENAFCEAYTMYNRNADKPGELPANEFNAWRERKRKEAVDWKRAQKCIYNKAKKWEEWAKFTKNELTEDFCEGDIGYQEE